MKARVLHLIDSSGFYGAERVIVTLCDKLKETAFSPILGCIMAQHAELPEVGTIARDLGIEVVPMVQTNKLDWRCIKEMIHFHDISIIHCHGYKPSLLSYIAETFSGIRIIVTCHLWNNAILRFKVYAFLESLIMRRSHKVVAVSGAIKDSIIKMGVSPSKVKVIFNGIDMEKWHRDENLDILQYKKQLGLKEDTVVLGLFGRLYKQKGHEYLFHALSRIKTKKIEVICVGDGPLKHELKQLVNRLDIKDTVHFLGFRHDVKSLLQITDLFMMPSLDEGLPMALLEAMAMEKAVVITPVGAIPYVIDDGHDGVFVLPKSANALADAITNLLDDPTKIKVIGRNAKKKVIQKFSSEVMTAGYLKIYREMVKKQIACQ